MASAALDLTTLDGSLRRRISAEKATAQVVSKGGVYWGGGGGGGGVDGRDNAGADKSAYRPPQT